MDKIKFNKADQLRLRLEKELNLKGDDVLSLYRAFLDSRGIESEGKDGYPNEDAYDERNINNFINNEQPKLGKR